MEVVLSSISHPMFQTNPRAIPKKVLPTMYDLPSEDPEEPGLPDEFHNLQPQLLRLTFRPPNYSAREIFVGSDINLYYDSSHTRWYKRPDWFAVVGVPRLYNNEDLRWSYVVWDEGVSPLIVVELLSPGTENEDLGKTESEENQPPTKWEVYEQILQIPYYVTFERNTNEIQAYQLTPRGYQPWEFENQGLWVEEVQMSLGLWQGEYEEMTRLWLRWRDEHGNWIPTPEEAQQQQAERERQRADTQQQQAERERQRADTQQQQAERERQRADTQQQRAERLAARLRELGIDPNEID
jgi:Uma2 family endonuclease